MYLLYSLLLTLGFLILLPRFVIDALHSGKYVTGLAQRLGNIPAINSESKSVIWLHCVSVGETRAAQALVSALLQRFANLTIVISTTTVTGQQMARDLFRDQAAAIFYFPVDWMWTVRRTLRAIRPKAVLLMETELWPNLLRECHRQEIPVALINGRISHNSFRRYSKIRTFIKRVLHHLTFAAMQSPKDAERIRELGLAEDRTVITGNVKFDSASASPDHHLTDEIRGRFQFDGTQPLIVAASTHAPEEAIMLDTFKEVKRSHPSVRLLIAPRHPERFDEVAGLVDKSEFSWARRSQTASTADENCDIVLLDTIGELRAVYRSADIVFVGGSIAPRGGQNMLEPAALGICIVTGPHTYNFAAITKALLDREALIQTHATARAEAAHELAEVLVKLVNDPRARYEMGQRARLVCERNRGATERSVELISQLLIVPANPDNRFAPLSTLHATTSK